MPTNISDLAKDIRKSVTFVAHGATMIVPDCQSVEQLYTLRVHAHVSEIHASLRYQHYENPGLSLQQKYTKTERNL